MAPLDRRDRLLLALLLPAYLVCAALHVHEVARSGLAQLPVWVVPTWDGTGYPQVGGYRVETDSHGSGLLPGDRLIRVGDRDLRGAGYIGFDALALAETGALGRAPLIFERDGVRREVPIWPRPHPQPWTRVPLLIGALALTVLVLLRAPGREDARRFFAAFTVYGLVLAQFYGGPPWKTWASLLLWNLGTPVAVALMLRWAATFPSELPADKRPGWGWVWAGVAAWLLVRVSYWTGGPIPPPLIPRTAQAVHAGLMVTCIGLMARNYVYVSPVGRRRLKWVLYGAVVGSVPLIATQLGFALRPDWGSFEVAFAGGTLSTAVWVLCIIVAIVRYNAFDIDRVMSATASASVLAVAFLAGALFALPELARRMAETLPIGDGSARALLALALLAVLVPQHRRLRAAIDQLLFPDRRLEQQGISQLLRDLSQCTSRDEVLDLVGERLQGVLGAEACVVYARDGDRLHAREPRGATGPAPRSAPSLPARGPLALALERNPVPLPVTGPELARAAPDRTRAEEATLAAARTALLLPVRCGKDLVAVVALGPRRSGDVYTRSDLGLLAAVAEKASAELLHLRDAETIRSERVRGDELARLRSAAEDALRRRSRFLAAASHDLRQPLHALRMYAGLLAERSGARDADDPVVRIQRSADALSEMFSALLDVSRLDSGAVEPRIAPMALDPLLDDLVAELVPAAEARGIKLRWLPSGLGVRSDPVLLGRIVRNLLTNAIRYTDEGEVWLAARRRADEVEIEVGDTGPGIPAARQEEVFREFVRLDPGDGRGGLGIGLSVVDRLVRTLDHRLTLDSTPGRGTRFQVLLPAVDLLERDPPAPGSPARFDDRVVLVVDDDLAVLRATRDLLAGWGCRVVVAASPDEALSALARRGWTPEAILADWRLADGRHGIDVIDAVQAALGRPIPAALLSGETARAVADAARARGVPFLAKPASPARLRALLTELLRRTDDA